MKSFANIIGMSMLTDKFKYTVFVDGEKEKTKLSDYDKKFKIREHSGEG